MSQAWAYSLPELAHHTRFADITMQFGGILTGILVMLLLTLVE